MISGRVDADPDYWRPVLRTWDDAILRLYFQIQESVPVGVPGTMNRATKPPMAAGLMNEPSTVKRIPTVTHLMRSQKPLPGLVNPPVRFAPSLVVR